MATLTVLKFQTPDGADQALYILKALQQQELITVLDAAVVKWPQGKKAPQTQQANSLTGVGALNGAFWGMLFGLIFFIPFFGLAIGAAMGALGAHFADYGIDDNFIKQVRDEVTPGTSAIFVMSTGAQPEQVINALRPLNPEIITTNLSPEQEAELREMFAPVEAAVEMGDEAGDGTGAGAEVAAVAAVAANEAGDAAEAEAEAEAEDGAGAEVAAVAANEAADEAEAEAGDTAEAEAGTVAAAEAEAGAEGKSEAY